MRTQLLRLASALALSATAFVVATVPSEVPAFAQTAPSLTLDKASYAPDATISVKFGVALTPPPGQQYWITVIKASEPDSSWGAWHYVKVDAASDELKAPGPGEYEVRLHGLYPKHAFKVLARVKITVAGTIGDCPANFKGVAGYAKTKSHTCKCATGTGGSVWGTDMYTEDSSICAAAAHAGVITSTGGTVTVSSFAGCSAYTGSKRNGISTGAWGSYGGSFYFPGFGSGACGAGGTCPSTFGTTKEPITCMCPAGTGTGSVWGSGTYTNDSSVCRAAIHAGAITADGGLVTAKPTNGCEKYTGTTANGVTSANWGSFGGSFYFPHKHHGLCK